MLGAHIGIRPSGPNGKYTRSERLRAALLAFVGALVSFGVTAGAFTLMDRFPNGSTASNVFTGVGILFTLLAMIAGVAALIHFVAAPFAPAFFEASVVAAAVTASAARDHKLSTMTPFQVSTVKFVVMTVVTLQIYVLYWCYQNWKRIRNASGEPIMPFWRAFFSPLWAVSLFRRIKAASTARGVPVPWDATVLGLTYLLLSILYRLPDPWWLVSLLAFVPCIPVVRSCAALNGAGGVPAEDANAKFSGWNIAGIVLGGIVLALALIGTFVPA